MSGGDVAHIVHIKTEERAQIRLFEQALDACEAFVAQPLDVDALLPIDVHQAIGSDCHSTGSFCHDHHKGWFGRGPARGHSKSGPYTRPQSVRARAATD